MGEFRLNLIFEYWHATPCISRKSHTVSASHAIGKYTLPYLEYELHPEAEDFLKQVPKPISVISVAGLYRTGKSYLLNRILLNRNNGFGVGPTINPCTKGLWCWGVPLKGTTDNG